MKTFIKILTEFRFLFIILILPLSALCIWYASSFERAVIWLITVYIGTYIGFNFHKETVVKERKIN